MIIGIDGNEANVKKRLGVSEYAYQLLTQFYEVKGIQFVIYLKDQPASDLPEETDHWHYRVITPGKLWTQWRLPLDLYLHKPRPDVFFTPSHYGPRFAPVPTVMTILDVSYLYFPELFKQGDLYKLRNWTAYSAKKAKKVLTISESSKNDIIKEYKIDEQNVVVTYPGIKNTMSIEPHIYGMNELKAKYEISEKYVLFVGTLQPRKNIVRLIEAFSTIDEKNLGLVIIGKKGWLYEEILEAPGKFGVGKKVKFLEGVSDEELGIFYKHAICFVLPSLYEGFGLPVLEAMKHGCPVITSNVSSLPEAGGDAALYVDPEDVGDIAEKIKKLVTNKQLREELIAKGKKQVTKFSWEKAAQKTLDVLQSVAKEK
jgi:glycosyltransferase involved in cell wall biosynthesis